MTDVQGGVALEGWESDDENKDIKVQNDESNDNKENTNIDEPQDDEINDQGEEDEQDVKGSKKSKKTKKPKKGKGSKKGKKGIFLTERELMIKKIMSYTIHPRFKERVNGRYELTHTILDAMEDNQLTDILEEIKLVCTMGFNQNLSKIVYGVCGVIEMKNRPKLDGLLTDMEKDDSLNDSIAHAEIEYMNYTMFSPEVQLVLDIVGTIYQTYRKNQKNGFSQRPQNQDNKLLQIEHKPQQQPNMMNDPSNIGPIVPTSHQSPVQNVVPQKSINGTDTKVIKLADGAIIHW
jgi:hypothetical protein